MQLLGLILLLASSWYLWKLTSNFLDEPTKKKLNNSFNNLKNKFSEGKQNFSKSKIYSNTKVNCFRCNGAGFLRISLDETKTCLSCYGKGFLIKEIQQV